MKFEFFKAHKIYWILVLVIILFLVGFIPKSSVSLTRESTTLSIPGDRVEHANALVYDFNNDGYKEIVVGTLDGQFHIASYNGTNWSIVYSRQIANDLNAAGAPSCGNTSEIQSAPSVADLDGDGKVELVITTGGDIAKHYNGGVLVYEYNGEWAFAVKQGWPQPKLDIVGAGSGASNPDGCWDGIWSSAALGDIDNDGDLEIVVQGFDRRMHAWNHDGTYVTGWPIQSPTITRGGWSTPALADIDEDGELEIIIGSDYISDGRYQLYVFNADGSILPGFPVQGDNNFGSSPAIGDIDGDGHLDIVVGGGRYTNDTKLHAWDRYGHYLTGWPQTLPNVPHASPALADIDNDGDLEVISGCGRPGGETDCKKVYAFHGNGQPVANFPVSISSSLYNFAYAPIVADYNGDNQLEILISGFNSKGPFSVAHNGAMISDSVFRTGNSFFTAPVVDDVDNDGKLEVVMASTDIFIWDTNGNATDRLPWPMFHQNIRRTGLVPQTADISGVVTDDGVPLSGVTITLNDGSAKVTDIDGTYLFSDVDPGTYVITPTLTGYTFNPVIRTIQIPPDAKNQDFSIQYYNVSGSIIGSNGLPYAGINISTGTNNGVSDQNGAYIIKKLLDGTHTIQPTIVDNYNSTPSDRTITIPPDLTAQDFLIMPNVTSMTLSMSQSGILSFDDTQGLETRLAFPVDTVDQTTTFILTPTFPTGESRFDVVGEVLIAGDTLFSVAGHTFKIDSFINNAENTGSPWHKPITTTIHYSSDDVRLVSNKEQLFVVWWNGSGWQDAAETCTPKTTYTRDITNKIIDIAICQPGRYSLLGPTKVVYLPLLMK